MHITSQISLFQSSLGFMKSHKLQQPTQNNSTVMNKFGLKMRMKMNDHSELRNAVTNSIRTYVNFRFLTYRTFVWYILKAYHYNISVC